MTTPDTKIGRGPESSRVEQGFLILDPFGPNDTYLLEGAVKGGMQPLTAQVRPDRALRVKYGLNTFQDVDPLTITFGNKGLSIAYASGNNHTHSEVRPNAVYGVALARRTINPQQEAVVLALSNDRYAIIGIDEDELIIQESLGNELVLDDHPTWVNATQGNIPVSEIVPSFPVRADHATYKIGVLNTSIVVGGHINARGSVNIGTTEISNHEPTPVDEVIESQGRIETRKAARRKFNMSGDFRGAQLNMPTSTYDVYLDGKPVGSQVKPSTIDFTSPFLDNNQAFCVQAGTTQLVAVMHDQGYRPTQIKDAQPVEQTGRGVELVLIEDGRIRTSYFVGQDGTFFESEITNGNIKRMQKFKIVDIEGIRYSGFKDLVVRTSGDLVGLVFHGEPSRNSFNRLTFDVNHEPIRLKWDEKPIAVN